MRFKVTVNCLDEAETIRKIVDAASAAGAGRVGKYSRVALVLRGYETWIPGPGAEPFSGTIGMISEEPSVRIEMQCEACDLLAVIGSIRANHDYEEPVIDVVRLEEIE